MSILLPTFKKNFHLGFDNFKFPSWLLSSTNPVDDTMNIQYQTNTDDILPSMLSGFFEGWPNPPSAETHLRILRGSSHIVLALNPGRTQVIGFITAVSDGVSCAFIPHLEVLPTYRGQEIGRELVQRMIDQLSGIYAIDLMCDEDVVPFYEKLGMQRATGMVIRNYENQSGLPASEDSHW